MQGTAPEDVYPNTIFLPGTGVQRGSTYIGDGDPLSPHWASVPNAYRYNLTHLFIPFQIHDMRYKLNNNSPHLVYRIDPKEVDGLPKIPAQPIGYADAEKLLEKLGGKDSPESWRGGIKGIDYKVT